MCISVLMCRSIVMRVSFVRRMSFVTCMSSLMCMSFLTRVSLEVHAVFLSICHTEAQDTFRCTRGVWRLRNPLFRRLICPASDVRRPVLVLGRIPHAADFAKHNLRPERTTFCLQRK